MTKFDPDGDIVYSTYLGGGGNDYANGLAVDADGYVYVTGNTSSDATVGDFPLLSAIQVENNGAAGTQDLFVTKLDQNGEDLVWSTYFGGGATDSGEGIAVDPSGGVYVTGTTSSNSEFYIGTPDFPSVNPAQLNHGGGVSGGNDAFVVKFASDGQSVVYSTYLGGLNYEAGQGIATDASGNAYVTGTTGSNDFPRFNPYQNIFGGGLNDAFVTKFSSSGSLIYSTYFGAAANENGIGIAADSNGNTYVVGAAASGLETTTGAYQETVAGGYDAFVTKFSADGQSLIFSTYLGGALWDTGRAIVIDPDGYAYVTGSTESENFPIQSSYQSSNAGMADVFVTKLNPSGTDIVYSAYLGGEALDYPYGIAVDTTRNVFVAGHTNSSSFPTWNAYQQYHANNSSNDAFVVKLSEAADFDADGLTEYEELVFGTQPFNWDTDGDIVDDLNDVFPLDGSETLDSDAIETRMSNNPSTKMYPDISGDRIVWKDDRNGAFDIYLYDLFTGTEIRVTKTPSSIDRPAISGDRIVWEETRDGNLDIYLYDQLVDTEIRITSDLGDQWYPAISGDRIVWRDERNSNADIYMYDLSKGAETSITTNLAAQNNPAISGDRIVWQDWRNGQADIYMYDLSTGAETSITTNLAAQNNPAISGDRIVWQDNRNGNDDIYMYDLSTGTETPVITHDADQIYPSISGDRIVWLDYRYGNWDVFMCDLSSDTETRITIDSSLQTYPEISGGHIVWEDWRNGNPDIYVHRATVWVTTRTTARRITTPTRRISTGT